MIAPGDLVGGLLDVHVGGLGLFGVHHVEVVVLLHRAHPALDLVGVEDQDGHAPPVRREVAQDVHELVPGGLQVFRRQGLQVLPGEDHVVAVHQQVLRPLFGGLGLVGGRALFRRGLFHRPEGLQGVPLDGAVGPLENGHELLVLLQAGPVGGGPGLQGAGALLLGGLLLLFGRPG